MGLVEKIRMLCNEKKITIAELERKLNFASSSIRKWDTQSPSSERLQKVADYFDVSTDYLLGRTEKRRYYELTHKEKKDIAIQAEQLLEGLDPKSEANYYGEPLDDEDKEKLHEAIELALSLTKVKAKKKFTPKKFRDNNTDD